MNIELSPHEEARRTARKVAYFAAICATVCGSLYLIGLAGKLIVDGTVHSTSAPGVQMVSAVVAILLNLSLLALFSGLRRQASGTKAVFADLAAVFMTLVCATSSINWFVQLSLLPGIAREGDPVLLALLDVHNNLSLMYAVEHLGWGIFYGLAMLWLAASLGRGRLETWIRWLAAAGGILSLAHVGGIAGSMQAISDLGYLAWGVLLPVTTTLLAIRSRQDPD